jgi:hypothetical protein
MEYNRLIAITGMAGLFELVSSKNEGAVVKSLEDQTVKFVSSRVHNFSHLESIEIYTVRENVNLVEILRAIETSGLATPDDKDAAAVKAYMQKVYPDMDFERVYMSDMKKMVKWYNIIKANNIPLTQAEENTTDTEEVALPATEAAPAAEVIEETTKKPAAKKPAKKKPAAE